MRKKKKARSNSNRESSLEGIRKLAVIGQSKTYYLTLPRRMVQKLKWQKGKSLMVQLKGKGIYIKP